MKHIPYLALLRGINVGGNNLIAMSALKSCFERQGFTDVRTYIQSGNVLFSSAEKNRERLVEDIERMLSIQFSYSARVALLSFDELRYIVKAAPKDFGANPEKYRYDVIFLRSSLTPRAVIKSLSVKKGVDTVRAGKRVLYFSRLIAKATQSHLSRLAQLPIYKEMTIRNWNTTMKLFSMMENEETGSSK